MANKFKAGDIIILNDIEREIVKVFKKSYSWKYLDYDEIFYSIDSTDPLFEMGGWKLKQVK